MGGQQSALIEKTWMCRALIAGVMKVGCGGSDPLTFLYASNPERPRPGPTLTTSNRPLQVRAWVTWPDLAPLEIPSKTLYSAPEQL